MERCDRESAAIERSSSDLTEESTSVQLHLQVIQNIIQRMAANSCSCKTWCITIVSAILVLIADKRNPELASLALFPSFLFFSLDAYYLAFEKSSRASYDAFITKLHNKDLSTNDLFSVTPTGNMSWHRVEAVLSFSVWGFYGAIVVLIFILKETVLA